MVNKIKALKEKRKRFIFYKDISLMLAMFFLPFGYDALFLLIMKLTGSYFKADLIFYGISGCFFTIHFLLQKTIRKGE